MSLELAQVLPIEQRAEVLFVDARKLHAALGVGRDFSTWIQGRLEEVDAIAGEDYDVLDSSPDLGKTPGGRPRRDYLLTLDIAKEVAMLERTETGKSIRRYFIACEKQLRAQPALPGNYLDALKALVASEESRQQTEAALAIAAPKASKWDAFLDTEGLLSLNDAAKALARAGVQLKGKAIGRNNMMEVLRDERHLCKDNTPSQKRVDDGHFVLHISTWRTPQGANVTQTVTKITNRGLDWLENHFRGNTLST